MSERALVKDVQRIKRAIEREKEGASRDAVIKRYRESLNVAEKKLAAFRAKKNRPVTVQLAARILAHKNTRCENYRADDGMTAGDVLREYVKRNGVVYCKQAGKDVKLNEKMLRTILRLAKYGIVRLNCLTNGYHSGPSSKWPLGAHPRGEGLDIGKPLNIATSVLIRLGAKVGAYVLNEDAGHWHLSFR